MVKSIAVIWQARADSNRRPLPCQKFQRYGERYGESDLQFHAVCIHIRGLGVWLEPLEWPRGLPTAPDAKMRTERMNQDIRLGMGRLPLYLRTLVVASDANF